MEFSLENFLQWQIFQKLHTRIRKREREVQKSSMNSRILREDSSFVILVKELNPKLIRKAKAFACAPGRGESWKFAYLPCNYPFSWIIHIRQLEDISDNIDFRQTRWNENFRGKWIEFDSLEFSFSLRLSLRIQNFHESYSSEIKIEYETM